MCCPILNAWRAIAGGADEFRGTRGPLHVQRSEATEPWRVHSWRQAAQAGYQTTDDISGYCQEGFGVFLTERFSRASVGARRGLTWILRVGAKNLTIVTRALVHRLNLSGNRVTGCLIS